MSYFMNPGGTNQISSFCSENLACNWRPEARDNDKSSGVSGVCLCLLKTLTDLSPSSPLCKDDNLSFQASRWPFVCNDLLIFFSPILVWIFILTLVAAVLASSSPGEKVGRTAAASKEVKKKKREKFFWLPTKLLILHRWSGRFLKNLKLFSLFLSFSSVINTLRISKVYNNT